VKRPRSDTLLDVVGELLAEHDWADVTMAQVARAAGVSRQTVYNEFGSRQELAQAYVLREGDLFLADVERAVAAHPDDPRGAVAAAFDFFLSAAATHPLLRAIVGGAGGDELLALVTVQGAPVLEAGTERLAAFLVRQWPAVGAGDARLVAESVVRLAISHAALPTGPAAMTAASVARLLGPFVDEVFTGRARG
jgi:AcrR family transcriptional regulator